jgi:hypothetical protein
MLTTAGAAFFTMGARLGTGVSPTFAGSWAAALNVTAQKATPIAAIHEGAAMRRGLGIEEEEGDESVEEECARAFNVI